MVQNGVSGESVFSLPPQGFQVFLGQTTRVPRRNRLSKDALLDDRFSTRRLLRSFDALCQICFPGYTRFGVGETKLGAKTRGKEALSPRGDFKRQVGQG